jgi:hypothetical protein
MICCRCSADKVVSAASRDSRTLFIIAPHTTISTVDYGAILARPNAPPIVLKKFLAPVTTARSFFGDVACAATSAIVRSTRSEVTRLEGKPYSKPRYDEISYYLAQ